MPIPNARMVPIAESRSRGASAEGSDQRGDDERPGQRAGDRVVSDDQAGRGAR